MTTKLEILEMGLRLWRVDPAYVTTRRIENELNMAHGTVRYHFGGIVSLKNAIAYHAVKQGESKVIVNLITSKHPAVSGLSEAERMEHFRLAH